VEKDDLRANGSIFDLPQAARAAEAPSMTKSIAEQMRNRIAESGMKAGEPLPSEEELSQMFAVSKRLIREALRELAAQGIVRTSQGKRAIVADAQPVAIETYFKFIRQMDEHAIGELFELREIVEVRAVRLAALRATPSDIEAARKALDEMEQAGDDADRYIAGDLAFHAAIMDAAHNRFLSAIIDALAEVLREERKLGVLNRLKVGDRPDKPLRDHRAVLEAVVSGDPDLAERQMVEHMRGGRVYIPATTGKSTKTGGMKKRRSTSS
jgi:GntR family transcriptional repressor for pyruvate dehydrogenase complex